MSKRIKLLLVEDNPGDSRLIKEMLRDSKDTAFDFFDVKTLNDARYFLKTETVDVVLLDLGLPDSSGHDTFTRINAISPDKPIIVLTGLQNEELAIKLVQEGAQDYLLKDDINSALLLRAILYAIERKNTELNLKEYAAIIEDADVAIYIRKFDSTVVSWNKGAEKIFGYKESEIVGKSSLILYPQNKFKTEFENINKKVMLGEKIIDYETMRVCKSGEIINVLLTESPIRDEAQKIIAIVIVGRNITLQKKLERILAIQYRISMNFSELPTLESAAFSFLKTICEILEWEVGELWAVDTESNTLRCVSAWSSSEKFKKFSYESETLVRNIGQGISGHIWSTKEIYFTSELEKENKCFRMQLVAEMQFHSCVGLPIIFKDEILGVIIFYTIKSEKLDLGLLSALRAVCAQMSNYIKRKRIEGDLSFLSQHDSLTGLFNRQHLESKFDDILASSKVKNTHIAFIFFDLDVFKKINDTAGHLSGDAVLIEVADRLRKNVRSNDFIARIGGDEFAIILSNVKNIFAVDQFANKLLTLLSKLYKVNELEFSLTASIGVSFSPDDGEDFQTLYKNADMALYLAKSKGGNNIQFSNPNLVAQVNRKANLEREMFHAIKNKEFLLYYQPIIDAKTHKIVCLEALVRWNHPAEGLLLPEEFIPLAEETHQIIPIGNWILQSAFEQLHWLSMSGRNISIAINLSSQQLIEHTILKKISEMIKQLNILPNTLELEITESIFMQDLPANISTIKSLNVLGAKISIDDFGTGYSSFKYLQKFTVDVLKIDQSFVNNFDNPKTGPIINAIISVAHAVGAIVVAEGVETKAQVDFLVANQCDRLQGFYFSKPLPEKEMRELLSTDCLFPF